MRRLLAAAVLGAALVLAVPGGAGAQTPPGPSAPGVTPAPATSTATPTILPDPGTISAAPPPGCGLLGLACVVRTLEGIPGATADAIFGRFTMGARQSAARRIQEAVDIAVRALHTPDFAHMPRVVELWKWSLYLVTGVGGAGLLLMCFGGAGVVGMLGSWTGLEPKVVIPRFVAAFVSAELSLFALAIGTEGANWLTAALGHSSPDKFFSATLSPALAMNIPLPAVPLMLFLAVLLAVTTVLRSVFLLLLIPAAPFAQGTILTPHSDPIARAWWRCVVALLLAPALQMLIIVTLIEVSGSAGSSWSDLFGPSALVSSAVVVSLLFVLVLIPAGLVWIAVRSVIGAKSRMKAARHLASTSPPAAVHVQPAMRVVHQHQHNHYHPVQQAPAPARAVIPPPAPARRPPAAVPAGWTPHPTGLVLPPSRRTGGP